MNATALKLAALRTNLVNMDVRSEKYTLSVSSGFFSVDECSMPAQASINAILFFSADHLRVVPCASRWREAPGTASSVSLIG
jgi:hypothetical protein